MAELNVLAAQLAHLGLDILPEHQEQLLRFQRELLSWNRKFNLTAIRDQAQSIEKHLVDSLTPLPLLEGSRRLLDLGSGPGLPAIPLKIVRPALGIVSVEAQEKKILFQRHVARLLGLRDFTPVRARIEEFGKDAAQGGAYDLVIARALARTEQLLAWAAPFLAGGGRLIAMKAQEEDGNLAQLATLSGFEWTERSELLLPASGAQRRLDVFTRVG
ncbi:16S rRNA (guanine(527)-N(7))-methyltransferase RsmG [Geoalkalibacter halelectricus]|uniref:Ribosomal RNA small subunit methyltransferase G n=1 Tax=Geoalkalibacter halelectricus TaxID=2847045 RepID=A0ABY5ZFW3_9BACT|nr:16S rRNA (guanine(527)-N(7))-methyltransferase RsmG [Geoalkalibacter halelectricus]MDO3378220.1 16S rRNA (guanine(527)-N(7))-methyltransferase RsmG [Geoalkalibacter halelectricus]UWZ78062.1 16S rRNA (guanine(527)-N(7))-methyltransferase RsmG [Geoalkalibacter halelectricus]